MESVGSRIRREEFITRSLQLLSLERATEVAENEVNVHSSISSRSCLHTLAVSSQKVGLYGRHILLFEAFRSRGKRSEKVLPANSISNGDIVGVFCANKPISGHQLSGVVIQVTRTHISVVFDDLPDSVDLTAHNGAIQLVKLANDITYRRIKRGLEALQSYRNGPCLHLISVLFSESSLLPANQKYISIVAGSMDAFPWHTPGLNSSQRKAVLFALSRPDVHIIHGPPGTGKTTTLVEFILQTVDLRMKVLACAPSNIAVDNLVEKLTHAKAKVVRLGHPARLEPTILQYSLDALVANSESAEIILDVRHDIDIAYSKCMKAKGSSDRRKWRNEMKTLRTELKKREEHCLKEILSSADIVLCTLTGSSPEGALRFLPDEHFDITVIDECAQAVEASCWIPLLRAPRCVLAGDHCQLPPTILSQEAADKGFSVTLMQRLVKEFGDCITSTLTTQYRMHEAIMAWPSHALYNDKLRADQSVINHLLSDLPSVTEEMETSVPLVFIDTAGCGLYELQTAEGKSKGNEGEADLVVHHINKLRKCGVLDKDIAVIAPYSLQVELIRHRVHALHLTTDSDMCKLEVHTVDGFQGREKEAVIISLTRSNDRGEYGFLKEKRRSNVAVTRARRHLCLIGDSKTVANEPFMKGMIEHCHKNGEVWSAHEYIQDSDFITSHYYHPTRCLNNTDEGKVPQKSVSRQKPQPAKASPKHVSKAILEPGNASLSPNMKATVSDQKAKTQTYFLETIDKFLQSDSDSLSFPTSLTGYERKIIHELCEKYGLLHESKGEGKDRFIAVMKTHKDSSQQHERGVTEKQKPSNKDPIQKTCDLCGRDIPLSNWELHHIQCQRAENRSCSTGHKTVQKNTKPKQQVTRVSAKAKHKDPADDLDSLLAEVTLEDATCKFQRCSKHVSLLGIQCKFCKKRYCMEHSLPEIHGCGDAARQQSRRDIDREVRRQAQGLTDVRRSQLQTKLTKKLEEKSSSRRCKNKGQ